MTATLHVLGAGSILPRVGYGCSGYVLRPAPGAGVTMLDCGPGSVRHLAAAGVAVHEVRRILFSHYHLDHCLDLFALVFARRNREVRRRRGTLELIGPVGLRSLVERTPEGLGEGARDDDYRLVEVEVDPPGGARLGAEEGTFTWAPTGHLPHSVAWRVDLAGGANVTYSGDAAVEEPVARLARGTDLLVAECSFPDGAEEEGHLTPTRAARIARAAGARRLVLSHFYPATDPEAARRVARRTFAGPVEVARDGSCYPLAEEAEA